MLFRNVKEDTYLNLVITLLEDWMVAMCELR